MVAYTKTIEKDYEPTDAEIIGAAKLFNIKKDKWNIIKCAYCSRKIDILKCDFDENDSPICSGGCHNG